MQRLQTSIVSRATQKMSRTQGLQTLQCRIPHVSSIFPSRRNNTRTLHCRIPVQNVPVKSKQCEDSPLPNPSLVPKCSFQGTITRALAKARCQSYDPKYKRPDVFPGLGGCYASPQERRQLLPGKDPAIVDDEGRILLMMHKQLA